jgi:hypothetical protein
VSPQFPLVVSVKGVHHLVLVLQTTPEYYAQSVSLRSLASAVQTTGLSESLSASAYDV